MRLGLALSLWFLTVAVLRADSLHSALGERPHSSRVRSFRLIAVFIDEGARLDGAQVAAKEGLVMRIRGGGALQTAEQGE